MGVVTKAWFAQREFTDTEILKRFQESMKEEKERGEGQAEEDREEYLGMSLRELVREFGWRTLVLFKCCLLQPKVYSIPISGGRNADLEVDAVLWLEMRKVMHDAVLADIPNTGSHSQFARLRGSGFG